jgi:hypothetical protein
LKGPDFSMKGEADLSSPGDFALGLPFMLLQSGVDGSRRQTGKSLPIGKVKNQWSARVNEIRPGTDRRDRHPLSLYGSQDVALARVQRSFIHDFQVIFDRVGCVVDHHRLPLNHYSMPPDDP